MTLLESLRLLDPAAVAQLLQLSAETLRTWRSSHKGPPFRRIGRRVLYEESDVVHWVVAQKKHNTSA